MKKNGFTLKISLKIGIKVRLFHEKYILSYHFLIWGQFRVFDYPLGCRADRFTIANAIHNFVNPIHNFVNAIH